MAVYFLRARHISRGKGGRVTRAAAYRAGERILDLRTSETHDFSDRRDIPYKEVVLPADLTGRPDMAWTQDRSTLWNAAEHAGLRRNSRLAREWLVFIPPELTPAQRAQLVRTFASELAEKYRCAVDACIHEPRPGADSRNHHAHLLMTTREVTPEGLGRRTTLELGGRERRQAGLGTTRDEYLLLRERWARVTNEALRRAGLTARVDHRSLESQGVGRAPVPSIPEKVFYAERRAGEGTAAGDAIRARHRERLEARLHSAGDLARVRERQKAELRREAAEHFARRRAEPKRIRWNQLTREERNAHRRKQYEARRAVEKSDPVLEAKRRESRRLEAQRRQQNNPESVREARRRWFHAHADEINRKQRAYRHAHVDEINRKRREYRQARAERSRSKSSESTAEQAAKNWLKHLERDGPGPTAEESARAWLGYLEREASADRSQSTPASGNEHGRARSSDGVQPDSPDRDHDFGL
jgi:MobA/MobL family